MKPQSVNRFLAALLATSGALTAPSVFALEITTNNTGISAESFTLIDNPDAIGGPAGGYDTDANGYGGTATVGGGAWGGAVSVDYPFTGLAPNTRFNIYGTWHYGGTVVGIRVAANGTFVADVPQNNGNAPNPASGFIGYDEVNDSPSELRNFQHLGVGTTDGSGNLTINVTRMPGMTYARWDAFAVAPAPTLPPPGPRYWDGNAASANSASDNSATTGMDWLNGGNWDNGTTSVPQAFWIAGDPAIFGGSMAGTQTITVSGSVATSGLTFDTVGYTITGGTVYSPTSLTLTTNADATIHSTVSGSPILKEGTGTLTLGKATGGAANLTIHSGTVSIQTGAFNSLGNPSSDITIHDGAVLSADNTANNAHNLGTLILHGGTLTSANGPGGPANDGGYGNWLLNAGGSGVIVDGSTASTISSTTLNVGTRTFMVNDVTSSPDTDLTISSAIIGGTLTKSGPGTMELTGANTYTGNTTVNEGTLKLGANGSLGASPTLTVATGATLDVSATAGLNLGSNRTLAGAGTVAGAVTVDGGAIKATGPLSVGSLEVGSTAILDIPPGAGSLTITAADGLNTGATGNTIYVDAGTDPITSGTYQLVLYQGTIQGDDGFAAFQLGTTPGGNYTYDLLQNGNSIELVVSPLAKLWTGALSSDWNTSILGPPKNWKAGLNPADFTTGDDVLFDDSAANTTVSINAADVSPGSVLFANNTKSFTLQGAAGISGSTELTMAGSGTVSIENTNSFTGRVNFNGGTVSVPTVADGGSNSPLGAGTEIVFGGGSLVCSGGNSGTDRTLFLDANATIEVASPGTTLALSGEITGSGSFTKTGDGTLALAFDNSYYGATHINAGTLSVATLPDGGLPSPLGASSSAAGSLVLAGGTLSYTGPGEASNRGFTLTAATSGTLAVSDPNAVLTLSGPVAGAGNFVKAGPGTLVRSANMRSYASLEVAAGKLAIGTADFNSLNTTSPVTIAAGAVLSAENAARNAHNLGTVTLTGGTLTSINGPAGPANDDGFGNWVINGVTAGGTVPSTISSTTLLLKPAGGGSIEVADVTGSAATDLLVSASILDDTSHSIRAILTKTGDGTVELTGRNTYTGNTTVNAGSLILADDASLTFVISNTAGASNKLIGDGGVILDGDFAIDTSAVTSLTTGTWQLENVTSLSGAYGATFTVIDPDGTPWTDAGSDQWTKTSGAQQWTFDETTGTLTLSAAAGFASWITGFGLDAADQGPSEDPDDDGVVNLVEYALAGRDPSVADGAAGTFTGLLLSFAKRPDASGITYAIEESDDLGLADGWTTATATSDTPAEITWLLPSGSQRKFARLKVSQAP